MHRTFVNGLGTKKFQPETRKEVFVWKGDFLFEVPVWQRKNEPHDLKPVLVRTRLTAYLMGRNRIRSLKRRDWMRINR